MNHAVANGIDLGHPGATNRVGQQLQWLRFGFPQTAQLVPLSVAKRKPQLGSSHAAYFPGVQDLWKPGALAGVENGKLDG